MPYIKRLNQSVNNLLIIQNKWQISLFAAPCHPNKVVVATVLAPADVKGMRPG
jgi:hypothetical protein